MKRRTGRTTRMLEQVKQDCKVGSRIFVVCADATTGRMLQDQFENGLNPQEYTSGDWVTYYRGGQIYWKTMASPLFDWTTLSFPGSRPHDIVHIDHHCFERRYGHILEAWCRYDAPSDSFPPYL